MPKPNAGKRPAILRYGRLDTPMGPVHVAVGPRGVCRVSFRARDRAAFLRDLAARFDATAVTGGGEVVDALRELRGYFAGRRDRLRFRVDLAGLSDFERRVLAAVGRVGAGCLVSYGELARRVGRPGAARAVGNALGRNPVPIRIPCHRVIAGDGRLGGFTGGTRFKRFLLRHEGHERRRDGTWDTTRVGRS